MLRVAIVGGGIAGLAAARRLAGAAHVTVIEAREQLGGHVRTIHAKDGPPLDCGFIVFNRTRYPGFSRMLRELGVRSQPSEMSFGVSAADGSFAYSTRTPNTLFADRRSLSDRAHRQMVADLFSFLARARRDHRRGTARGLRLDQYLDQIGARPILRERFVFPLAGALWSAGRRESAEFPAEVLLGFLAVHGMLRPALNPRWRTIRGGSSTYVEALRKALDVDWQIGSPVVSIERSATEHNVVLASGHTIRADRTIIAAHADQALAMLSSPSHAEAQALGAIRFTENDVVVHTDARILPAAEAARAAWNYRVTPSGKVEVTYWCNKLQRLSGPKNYMSTLNPRQPIDVDRIVHRTTMRHPCFDLAGLDARRTILRRQGEQSTYFAGAYFGYGFHEDGFRSGVAAADALLADAAESKTRRAA